MVPLQENGCLSSPVDFQMVCIIVYPAVIEVSESFTHQKLRIDELLCLSRSSGNHVPIVGMSLSLNEEAAAAAGET